MGSRYSLREAMIIGTRCEGRPCDANEISRQIGAGAVLAISGGRQYVIKNDADEVVGLRLPIDGTRRVDIVLDWDDTYIVRRMRRVVAGKLIGTDFVEFDRHGVYCDEVAEVAYAASCWK